MNSVKLQSEYLNRTGDLFYDGMKVQVKIIDAKMAWGSLRFLVTPISGSGTAWKDAVSVALHTM